MVSLTSVRWILNIVIICISHTAKHGDHSFQMFVDNVYFFFCKLLSVQFTGLFIGCLDDAGV